MKMDLSKPIAKINAVVALEQCRSVNNNLRPPVRGCTIPYTHVGLHTVNKYFKRVLENRISAHFMVPGIHLRPTVLVV